MSEIIKNTFVNEGLNFEFNGKISQEVLENYLSRSICYFYASEFAEDTARAILNVGAKYICRTLVDWFPSSEHEAKFPEYKAWMEKMHAVDPDIIFEACIFETCGIEMNDIKIPAHVFEAFGKPAEDRCFDYKKMEHQDGYCVNLWCADHSLPDITQEEYQMFVYYRGCAYIDLGIEAIHMGQTGFIGQKDPDRVCWTKVVHMLRDYAAKNARRGYVLYNCHYQGHNFVGTDGVMLADFNIWPLRLKPADGEVPHEISEDNPQRSTIDLNRDAPYKKGVSGTSPSGWKTEKYPYLLEFDNFGGKFKEGKEHNSIWGYDEISWAANQPDWYRREFLTTVRKLVSDLNESGHVSLIGRRCAYREDLGKMDWYQMNTKSDACPDGFSDEEAIIEAFKTVKNG